MILPWHLTVSTWEEDPQVGDTVHVGLFGKEEILVGKTTGSYWDPEGEGDWPWFYTKDAE